MTTHPAAPSPAPPDPALSSAYDQGRRAGLATAALLVAVVSFISLLGAEKAIAAIALGTLALRGGPAAHAVRRMGAAAIALGSLFLLTMAVVLLVWWDRLAELVRILQQLS